MLAFAEETWSVMQLAKIALLDILLAGDNAVVIALAVRLLPRRQQMLGRLWGMAGAVGLRILFLACASWLLAIPWLQFVGGLLLLWIAWKLLAPQPAHVESADGGGGGENDEVRGLDEAAIMLGDMVDLLDHRRAGRLAVDRLELSFGSYEVRHCFPL